MSEWHIYKLKDITTKIGSGSTPTGGSGAYKEEGISLIRSQNVLDYKFTEDGLAFIDDDQAYALRNVIVEANDVLLNITGDSVARCCGAPVNWLPARVNQPVAILRSNPIKLDYRFLKYSLLASKEELLILSEIGGTRNALTKGMLEDYEVSLPPLPEQKAIASVLSSLDDKIDLLHRQNKTLEAMAETLFRQWFIEEAKEDWEKVSLCDIVNITSSKRIFYSEYVDEGIPFYRSKEIIELNKSGQTSNELFITNERFEEIASKFGAPIEGDILLTSVGTLGVTYQVKADERFYFKDGNLTWFKDFKQISSNIIFCWLNSKEGKEQLENISIGSTQAALTIQGLKSLELILPPIDVIQILNEQLIVIYQKVNANFKQIRTLEQLRDTLLPKLMSGEVRVQYQTVQVT
ncbi:restriction endonuclease subunit S [Acinetobacter bereziniae]|uniref:restriction endonuclease subunit S n=1 Tax=Acinetobacter bereziniae TaxID=106648 RepID=UPI001902222D|nr:restriction endonuclease subunit S [Acinetobacter bereziniae]MBJ9903146.1 restriction endonuclease subunit S [Acinetobacter bereziniae]MCU4598236.1 restriction endonuclease subunit S [Acinetobacter bereziniae]